MNRTAATLLSLMLAFSLTLPLTGCKKRRKKGLQETQLQAIKGEDIPLNLSEEDLFFEEPADSTIFSDIYFDYDSPRIREEDKMILEGIASYLQENASIVLRIEGHCDERGSNQYNLALGEQRALGVRRYIVGLGIDPERVFTISYGEEQPTDPSNTEESWAKNRRAHFLVATR